MTMTNSKMRSTAVAALLSLPVATGGALAQQSQETDQAQPQSTQSQDATQGQSSQTNQNSGQASGTQQADARVATVGDAEILGSDVMAVIGMFPPQLQAQPPQMLVPMAVEQLILRELILADARRHNLAADPEVIALVETSSQAAEEDAMVQVWLDREMANVVTDEAVQQVYSGAQAQGQQGLPSIDAVRPQIEQHLRQQAIRDLQTRLRQGADVVLYDPTGQPVAQQQSGQAQQNQGSQSGTAGGQSGSGGSSDSTSASQSGDNSSGGQSNDGTSGSSNTSGGQTQAN